MEREVKLIKVIKDELHNILSGELELELIGLQKEDVELYHNEENKEILLVYTDDGEKTYVCYSYSSLYHPKLKSVTFDKNILKIKIDYDLGLKIPLCQE